MTNTDSRLIALEKQVRFCKAAIAGLLVALVALVGYGATEGIPQTIQARKIEILDPQGREVVSISANDFGGAIALAKSDGKPLVVATGTPKGSGAVFVHMKNSKGGVWIHANDANTGGEISVLDTSGRALGVLRVFKDSGHVFVAGPNQREGVFLVGRGERLGGGQLGVYNKTGERVVDMFANENGLGVIGVYDRQGKGRTLQPR